MKIIPLFLIVIGGIEALLQRHNYRYALKSPFFYLDNATFPFYEYFGAVLPSDISIRLTPSIPHMKGSVWSKQPNNAENWIVELGLSVAGPGDFGGHGIAFWYTQEPGVPLSQMVDANARRSDRIGQTLGNAFGSTEQWKGLGLFFDSYDEETHHRNMPLVYGIINDGSKKWTDMKEQQYIHESACFKDFRNKNVVKIQIQYLDSKLSVMINNNDGNGLSPCFTMENIKLAQNYWFGVSAHTGNMPDDHDLHYIEVYHLDPTYDESQSRHVKDSVVDKHAEETWKKVQEKVQHLRHDHEEEAMFHRGSHSESGSHGGSALEFQKMEGLQFKIVEKLDYLLANNIGHANDGASSGGGEEFKNLAREVRELTDVVMHMKADMDESFDLLRDIGAFISHMGTKQSEQDQNHIAQQLANLHHQISSNMEKRHFDESSYDGGGYRWTWTILYFLIGQVAILLAYIGWKRKPDESKKFI